jgi:hypothetical protein
MMRITSTGRWQKVLEAILMILLEAVVECIEYVVVFISNFPCPFEKRGPIYNIMSLR